MSFVPKAIIIKISRRLKYFRKKGVRTIRYKSNEIIGTVLLAISIFIVFAVCSKIEMTYTRKAVVTEINNTLVTFTDECGYNWQADLERLEIGDRVKLIMDNNTTNNNIKDDKIIKIKIINNDK